MKLSCCLSMLAGLFAFEHAYCSSTGADAMKETSIGAEPQIFVDDWIISSKKGVVRTLHPCKKLDEPVMEPKHPWESDRIYTYGTVHYDADRKRFRMWHQTSFTTRPETRDPRLHHESSALVLQAVSGDGVHWIRPNLGLYDFEGSGKNNIVFDLASPSVIVDEREDDPAKRYKMAGSHRGYRAAYSADGLTWKDYPVNPIMSSGDTITTTRDPATGDYLAFHKRPAEVRGHRRRSVWLSTSQDFQKWSKPTLILAPDEQDDAWVQNPQERTEFYVMSGFPYGGQFLGLLSVFKLTEVYESVSANQSPHDGPIDIQLTHSRDGRDWKRFEDRSPIIPLGEPGAFDAGCILGVSNPPVIYNDEIWVYYTGINTTHGGALPPKRITIGRAAWRLDGFVSLDAGPEGGIVETVPLKLPSGRLEVNADASKGSLAVEVLSVGGKAQPGFSKGSCEEVGSDSIRHVIRWNGNDRLEMPEPVRLRFYLRNAKLYSFRIKSFE